MRNTITALMLRLRNARLERATDVHFHLDVDGERVCEDARCPHRASL
jgi:hypothetical protein